MPILSHLLWGGTQIFHVLAQGGTLIFARFAQGGTEKFAAFARLICRPPQVVINERSLTIFQSMKHMNPAKLLSPWDQLRCVNLTSACRRSHPNTGWMLSNIRCPGCPPQALLQTGNITLQHWLDTLQHLMSRMPTTGSIIDR